ncbi:helix-turn-helix domain-containing protein [Rhizobium sp. A37_96]
MNDEYLTAGNAAKRLRVSPATLQRWVEKGVLIAEKTRGGHRRVPLSEIRRLETKDRSAEREAFLDDWLQVFRNGDPGKLAERLRSTRIETGSWAATAELVSSALQELGHRWEIDDCNVYEEHIISEALRRALLLCDNEISSTSGRRRALIFSVAGDQHTMGLSLAELILHEHGWRTIWVGEGPPLQELSPMLTSTKPDLVVISGSGTATRKALVSFQKTIERAIEVKSLPVILAGVAAWKRHPRLTRVRTFLDFEMALIGMRDNPTGSQGD